MSFYLSKRFAPVLETNLRAEHCGTLYVTDASPSCFASISQEDWLAVDDLAEEKGEHVRLDWKGEEPPSNMYDGRAAAALLALQLNWATLFLYRFFFFEGKHINLLELESLISLLRRVTRGGVRGRRLLVVVDSRVVLGSRLKRTIDLTKNQLLASKAKVLCLAFDIALELVWVPYLGKSNRCPFMEQANRKLLCFFAKAFFYADRSVGISSNSLGAGSAP